MAFCPNCGEAAQDDKPFCASCGHSLSSGGTTVAVSAVAAGPKCPTCNSSDLEKISLKSKIGSAALVGVFALGRISKTFKCQNCGYTW